ncbi:Dynein light chain 2, cytoplasmic, partial [Nipponia nippon]
QTSMGDQTAVGKGADMSEEMHQRAVERAVLAIEKYNVEREVAALIKRVNFDRKYNPTWPCAVGRNSDSRDPRFILACLGPGAVLL